jgi:2-hydroxy-3-keto-5-methylthiopentenyl-1-phosphate phosphatase
MTVLVLVDFDGTIVRQDVTDLILERFALPEWRAVEQAWVAGRIGSRECMSRQIDFVRATDRDLDELLDEIDIDPHFSGFVSLCRAFSCKIIIASDGLDRVIASVLARSGLHLPFVSNRLVRTGVDRWRLQFPAFNEACEVSSGCCKCALTGGVTGPTVLVGDGRSDFCVARCARWVLAKGQLVDHCRASDIPYRVINDFADAIEALQMLLAGQGGLGAGSVKRHDVMMEFPRA